MVRLKSENREGEIVRNNMLKHLWEDVDKRTRKLGVSTSHQSDCLKLPALLHATPNTHPAPSYPNNLSLSSVPIPTSA